MSSSITIMQSLCGLANSSKYCPPIVLNSKMEFFHDYKFEYQSYSNNIEIAPPSIWLGIQQTRCLAMIKNDVQRSRVSRQGLLSTNQKGNLLNKIIYSYEEDIGTIQQTQQCFCVAFSVVKDNCQSFLDQIGSQLRSCLVRKSTLIDRSHLNVGQLDELSKQIYNKYRIFLIFDTKSQPGRIISIYSCYFPNVRFNIQRIIRKDNQTIKFSPNQVFMQLQKGQIVNTFGFMSLDNRKRLLLIKKDDPELSKDNLIGVWVTSSFKAKGSRKQFGKQDAIWLAILDFYTNPEIMTRLSIISNQRGFLCYFNLKKSGSRLDSPQYYLFQPSVKSIPKWSFLTKSQFVTDLTKPYQIKIDSLDNTIAEEKQYSQFSDQPNIENINRQNYYKETKGTKNSNYKSNESAFSGSSQGKETLSQSRINERQKQKQNQKQKIIKQLKQQLQKYKQRCAQLQIMNRILMQEKMMVNQLYQNQCQIIPHTSPLLPYSQMPVQYPLSLSQVGPHNSYPINQMNHMNHITNVQAHQIQSYPKPTNSPINSKMPTSPYHKINDQQKNSYFKQKEVKATFSFPEVKQQQITFGSEKEELNPNQRVFTRKNQAFNQKDKKQQIKPNKQTSIQANIHKKDVRNISFQDSFAEYHSDGEQDGPTFKSPNFLNKDVQKTLKIDEFQSSKKINNQNSQQQIDKEQQNFRSPQFKKTQSLQSPNLKDQQEKKHKQPKKQIIKQMFYQQTKLIEKEQQNLKQKQFLKNKELKKIQQKNTQQLEQKQRIIKKIPKKIEIQSNQSQQQQKKKFPLPSKNKPLQKQDAKKQAKKPVLINSGSDDSDEDQQLKRIRLLYLKR